MASTAIWNVTPIGAGTKNFVFDLCGFGEKTDFTNVHVLDFGCGNGRYLEVFAQWIPKNNLIGMEVDKEQVIKVKETGFECLQIISEQDSLPFPDETFEIVFSSNVIEHIPRHLYLKYLSEIHRVLKPNGRFVVGTPNYPIKRFYDISKAFKTKYYKYYLLDDPTHCNKLSIRRLEQDLLKDFRTVVLFPTYIAGESFIPLLKNERIRKIFKIFGDKISGYCVK